MGRLDDLPFTFIAAPDRELLASKHRRKAKIRGSKMRWCVRRPVRDARAPERPKIATTPGLRIGPPGRWRWRCVGSARCCALQGLNLRCLSAEPPRIGEANPGAVEGNSR